jgi:photosynthesis system II assembly factor YCF48-like protein
MEKPMAPDERDRSFDKALSRHLRSAASPGVSVNLPSSPAAPSSSCLDSETLAAYYERSLLPQEMNSWKEHVVGCARCQAILAQLEATDLLPLQAAVREKVPAMEAAKVVAVARKDQHSALAVLSEKSRASRFSTGVRWRWLAPASALAAGLLVWVAWHENRPVQVTTPSEVNVARVEQPSTRQAPGSSQPDQLPGFSKDQGAIGGAASSEKLSEQNIKQLENLGARPKAAPHKPSTRKKSGARQDAERDSSLAVDRMQNQPALDAKTGVAGAARETVEVQNQAANAQVQNQMNAQKIPGPSPLGQAGQTAKDKSDSAARAYRSATAPPPQPAPASAFSDAASMELGAVTSPHLITAPSKKTVWRVGHAGLIEFSSDTGASWSRQTSNVLVDLTSGSAPSDRVCWIVGRAGTILLTTDGGEHWSIIHAPIEEDLEGVHAWDPRHAVVFANRGFEAFETKNGGKTWKRWISEE